MDRNRPQGREKHVTENGTGVYKKDQVQTSGPVGSGHGPGTSDLGTGSTESSGRKSGVRSATRSPITILLILAMLLFGGGSGLFNSGLVGGGSSGGGNSSSLISSLSGGSSSSAGWKKTSNVGKLDTSVADGSRAKRTQILGNGQDTVTMMIYMCGTDLESKNGMATSDLMEMVNAKHSDKLNIIVYTGGCSRWNNKIISSTKNQVYQVADGGLRCLVADAGSGAMTDPSNLAWFIQYCSQNFPANRNELIFWDHGSGSVLGYGYDEKNKRAGSMTLAGINEALKAGGVTFDFIGHYTDICENPVDSTIWLNVSAQSILHLEKQKLNIANDLAAFPTPFFDIYTNEKSVVSVVMPQNSDNEMLKAAAIVTSYGGKITKWRGVDYPAFIDQLPASGNAIVFLTNSNKPEFLKDYPEVKVPSLEVADIPGTQSAKMLIVSAPDSDKLVTAAKALASGTVLLSGPLTEVYDYEEVEKRKPYDAPNWADTSKVITFGSLAEYDQQLSSKGYNPMPINIELNFPPDLYFVNGSRIDMNLIYKYTKPSPLGLSQLRFITSRISTVRSN